MEIVCSSPTRSCPFDGSAAQERITVLETEQKHLIKTQDQMLEKLQRIDENINKITLTFLEYSTQVNTAATVGWKSLELWTKALMFLLGGAGTLSWIIYGVLKYADVL